MPASAQAPAGFTPPPYGSQPASAGMTDNVASALCYVLGFVTGVFSSSLEPYNKNKSIRFHAFQSIFLNISMFLVSIALSIVFGMVSFLGSMFGLFLAPLIWLAYLGVWIYMMVSAYQGKKVVLPMIGPLAEQQA